MGRVALAVGGDSVTVRQIDLPSLSDAELASTMPFEARRHVPIPAEIPLALSFQVLSRSADGSRLDVLLGACPKSLVDDAVSAAERAGLTPVIVDVAPLAGLNAILHARSEGAATEGGHLDIGSAGSTLTLFRAGGLLLCRRITVGGAAMTAEVAERSGITVEEAERIRRGEDPIPAGGLLPLVETSVTRLANEVRASVAFFDSKTGRQGLKALHLGGGGSKIAGLAVSLQARLGVPVVPADPLPQSPGASEKPAAAAASEPSISEYAVAIGLTRWWESPA